MTPLPPSPPPPRRQISFEGLRALGEMLARDPSLLELDLSRNGLAYSGDGGCVQAYRVLGRGLCANSHLVRLKMSGEWVQVATLRDPEGPEADFSGPELFDAPAVLGNEGAAVVAPLLSISPVLSLRLRRSAITDVGVAAIARSLAPQGGGRPGDADYEAQVGEKKKGVPDATD